VAHDDELSVVTELLHERQEAVQVVINNAAVAAGRREETRAGIEPRLLLAVSPLLPAESTCEFGWSHRRE
jgi:hypothetical protein